MSAAKAAERIVEKIAEGRILDGMPVRDIYVHCWSGLGPKQVKAGLALLERLGTVRTEREPPEPRGGRPSILLRLLPDVAGVRRTVEQ